MAKKTRTELSTLAINTNLPDNTSELITPTTERAQLTDERESVVNYKDDLGGTGNAGKFLTVAVDGESLTMVDEPQGDIQGSGVDGQITYWDGTKTVTSDAMLLIDTTNKTLKIVIPLANGSGGISLNAVSASATSSLTFLNNGVTMAQLYYDNSTANLRLASDGDVEINPSGTLSVDSDATFDGSVGIGKTPSTFRLDLETTSGGNGLKITRGTADFQVFQAANGASYVGTGNADTLHLITGSTSKVAISSGGDVGIGTDSPSTLLEARANTATTDAILTLRQLGSGDSSIDFQTSTSPFGFCMGVDGSDSDSFKISTGLGNVGTDTRLRISSTGAATLTKTGSGVNDPNLSIINSGADEASIYFNTQHPPTGYGWKCGMNIATTSFAIGTINSSGLMSDKLAISSGGSVFINKTGNNVNEDGFDFGAQGFLTATCNFSGANEMIVLNQRGTGTTKIDFRNGNTGKGSIVWTTSATAFNTTSDHRLKENVTPITDALSRVNQLKPSRFNFIADADNTVDGFIAHEVEDIIPEAISGEKDAMRDEEFELTPRVDEVTDEEGNVITEAVEAVMETRSVPDYQGIDQSKIVPLLTAAIQEQQTIIADLITRLEALEA